MPQTFTKVTGNNQVSSVQDVVVEIAEVVSVQNKRSVTIAQLDAEIATDEKHVTDYQASVTKLKALKAKVLIEAKKAVLKTL